MACISHIVQAIHTSAWPAQAYFRTRSRVSLCAALNYVKLQAAGGVGTFKSTLGTPSHCTSTAAETFGRAVGGYPSL